MLPCLNPSTKHSTLNSPGDAPMSAADLVKNGYITKEDYDECASAALAVFKFGQVTLNPKP